MFSPQANQRLLFGVIGPFIIIFLRLSSVSLDRSRCHFMRSQTIRTDRALADCYSWTAWSSGLTHARNRQGLMLKVLTIHRERTRRIVKGKLPIHDEKPLVFRWNSRRFQIAYRSNPLARHLQKRLLLFSCISSKSACPTHTYDDVFEVLPEFLIFC